MIETGNSIPPLDDLEWGAYVICWPKGIEWYILLSGIMSYPARGRYWDGDTGVIVDAQAVGRQIKEYFEMAGCDITDVLIDISTSINLVATNIANATAQSSAIANLSCFGCGGSEPPTTGGEEGGTPPINFDEPPDSPGTPAYDQRKCDVAGGILSDTVSFLTWLDDNLGPSLPFNILFTIIPLFFGNLGLSKLLSFVAGQVMGYVASVIIAIFGSGGGPYEDAITELTDNFDFYLCLLASSSGANEGREAVISGLSAAGVSTSSQNVVRAIMAADLINYLFFSGGVSETTIGDLPVQDCGDCGNCPVDLADNEFFTFFDASEPPALTTRIGASDLRCSMQKPATPGDIITIEALWTRGADDVTVAGDTISLNVSKEPEDNNNVRTRITVRFSDATEDSAQITTTADNYGLAWTVQGGDVGKTVEEIEISQARSTQAEVTEFEIWITSLSMPCSWLVLA